MIKVAVARNRSAGRDPEAFRRYLTESHGPLVANEPRLRRYVQHPTMPEAYGHSYAPTFDSVAISWYDDLWASVAPPAGSAGYELARAIADDGAELFDESPGWPAHLRQASVIAEEVVILDGPVRPDMVKTLVFACRMPGLSLAEFFAHWRDVHGALASRAPGLRRYVQNHAVPLGYAWGNQRYDGWAEMWFDDLDAVYGAISSAEWQELRVDGNDLFTRSHMGIGIGREVIQKEPDWTPTSLGLPELSDAEIGGRLAADGYRSLAADATVPGQLRTAAAAGALALWSPEHLVTIDESRIDARPDPR